MRKCKKMIQYKYEICFRSKPKFQNDFDHIVSRVEIFLEDLKQNKILDPYFTAKMQRIGS